jgi:hypothetical protein
LGADDSVVCDAAFFFDDFDGAAERLVIPTSRIASAVIANFINASKK